MQSIRVILYLLFISFSLLTKCSYFDFIVHIRAQHHTSPPIAGQRGLNTIAAQSRLRKRRGRQLPPRPTISVQCQGDSHNHKPPPWARKNLAEAQTKEAC